MLNLVGFDLKEKIFSKNIQINDNTLGFHIFNKNTDFYVRYEDLKYHRNLSWCSEPPYKIITNLTPFYNTNLDYNGYLQTENIIRCCEKFNIVCPAIEYCVSKGGYLGTLEQVKSLINESDKFSVKGRLPDVIWSSTMRSAVFSWVYDNRDNSEYFEFNTAIHTVIPFYNDLEIFKI